jgi:hypothetical protein
MFIINYYPINNFYVFLSALDFLGPYLAQL